MSHHPLSVLFVSAEVAPFSSVGGLSQVSYFLPRALLKMGVDVRIFTPKYGTIDEKKLPTKIVVEGMKVPTGEPKSSGNVTELVCNVKVFAEEKRTVPTVYLLENMEYFEKRANVYGYSDDHIRFGLLSRGAIEFLKQGFFAPDVVHANDWHTAYLINYLRADPQYKDDPELKKIATLLSIHNIYQGVFDFEHASELDLDDGKGDLAPFFSEHFFKQNPLKRGVIYTDLVNTVSETYARELLKEEYGRGLQNLFRELRGKLYGVLNGLDYDDFNPSTDKLIKKNFHKGDLKARAENKIELQKQFGLEINPDSPLLAISGRIDRQKGIDLVVETMEFFLKEMECQLVVLGAAEPDYRQFLLKLEKDYSGRVGTHLRADFALPRKIFAGADIMLLPSQYEPGGIVAIEAMRYGCVPVVRATGGLADSVSDYNPATGSGTGFTFKTFSREGFLIAVTRAIETYKNREAWHRLIRRAMEQDFSWNKSAEKYVDLYSRAIEFRKETLRPNPPMAFRQEVT